MRAVAIGLGAREALRAKAESWTVSASFPKATYVCTPEWMFVVTSRSMPRGPLYLAVDAADVFVPPGTSVTISGSQLHLGTARLEAWESAEVWIGDVPDPMGLRRHREMAIAALAPLAQRSALQAEPFSRVALRALPALKHGHFSEVSRMLLGLGPGLTPAGDDALAGILIAARFLGELRQDVSALATAGSTSSLSLSFVRWAARGQAIAPIHAVLTAGAAGSERRCRAAVAELARMGATSGADCAFGIAAALRTIGARPVPLRADWGQEARYRAAATGSRSPRRG